MRTLRLSATIDRHLTGLRLCGLSTFLLLLLVPSLNAQVKVGNPTVINASTIGASAPQGLAYHPGRNSIFVFDTNSRITEIDLNGNVVQFFNLGFVYSGGGVSYDPVSGQLLVTNDLKVFQVAVDGSSSFEIVDLDGDVFASEGIAVHPQSGNIWIADDNNEEVVQVDRVGNFISSFSSLGVHPTLIEPTGLSFLGDDLLIADDKEGSHSLYLASSTGQLIQIIGDTSSYGITDPEGVTAVGSSQIWICGDADNKIVRLERLDSVNQPPTANAGPDQTVAEGSLVTLDGNGSSDPDFDSLTFSWLQTGGPSVSLGNPGSAVTSFVAPAVTTSATLTFQLTVDDGESQDTDSVTVVVQNVNLSPVANAGPDQVVLEGSQVTLDGSESFDPEAEPLTYLWQQTGGPTVSIAESNTSTASFTAPSVDQTTTLTFRLTVSDGNSQDLDLISVQVQDGNRAPVIVLASERVVSPGESVTLTASVSDPDGDPVTFQWTQTDGPTVTLSGSTTSSLRFTAPAVTTATTLTFKLEASDGKLSSTSETSVTVSSGARTFYFPQVGDGRFGDIGFQTSLILVSKDRAVTVLVDFFDSTGSPMEMQLGDLGLDSSFTIPLDPGEAVSLQTPGTGSIRVGYARVSAEAEIGGTAVFTRSDASSETVLYEAGVPASEVGTDFSLFVDSKGARDTGLAIVYPNTEGQAQPDATVTLILFDDTLNKLGEETLRLAAGEHLARYVFQLFPDVTLADEMEGVLSVSSDRPLAAITLRQNDEPDQDFPIEVPTLTTFPVISLPSGSQQEPVSLYFPQVGDGRFESIGFQTSLILMSKTQTVTALVEFFDSTGAPMEMQLGDLGLDSSFSIPLDPGEAVSLQTPGTGSIKVGYARVSADAEIGGTVVFTRSDITSNTILYEAGVPASKTWSDFRLFVDSTGVRDTGLALVYPRSGSAGQPEARVTLSLFDTKSHLESEVTLLLEPGEHLARYVFQLFPELPQASEMEGVLVVSSDRPLAAITLRQNDAPNRDFPDEVPTLTTFPVIP